jgi:3',5'-nucleoside bisphosphate phosphatase
MYNQCMIDLHVHTNVTAASGDSGDSSPAEMVKEAKRVGLSTMAITDHDSVAGIQEGIETAQSVDIQFVPGVEIACTFEGIDIEIVALGIDHKLMENFLRKDPKQIIKNKLDFIRRSHEKCASLGIKVPDIKLRPEDIYVDELHEVVQGSYVLEENRKRCREITGTYPNSENEYYKALFANGKPCRVVKDIRTLENAMGITHQSGGKAFLAHPKRADSILACLSDESIERAVVKGLDGLECIHSKMMPKDSVKLIDYCRNNNLLMTGGSDTHGLDALESWNARLQVPDRFISWYFH